MTQPRPINAQTIAPRQGVLMTRPLDSADTLAQDLADRGYQVWQAPLQSYVPLAADYGDLAAVQALLFTSRKAVELFAASIPTREWPVFCVGAATAAAAEAVGFKTVHAARGDGPAAAEMIAAYKDTVKIKAVLHPCGVHVAHDLAAQLAHHGITLLQVPVYEAQLAQALPSSAIAALRAGTISAVLFFSARVAAHFEALAEQAGISEDLKNLTAVCLSQRIASALDSEKWGALLTAATPEREAVLALLAAQTPTHDHAYDGLHMTDEYHDGHAPATDKPQERRTGEDRRTRMYTADRRGQVSAPTYKGADRRAGIDRRAYMERQHQRIRAEKWKFIHRTLLSFGVLFFLIVLAGVFVMAPEYADMEKRAEEQKLQMAALKNSVTDLHAAQEHATSVGAQINHQLERIGDLRDTASAATEGLTDAAADAARSAAEQAAAAAPEGSNLQQLLGMVGRIDALNRTKDGRAAMDQGHHTLQSILSNWSGNPDDLNQAVDVARKQDPTLAQVMSGVDAKDLGAAALLLTLNEFRSNVGRQQPFDKDLAMIQKFAGADPEMQKSINRLAPYARQGVLSREGLQTEFKGMAMDIVTAKLQGQDLSVQEEVRKRMQNYIRLRKVDDVQGQSVDAVVARAQILLDQGDVRGAMAELNSLEGAPAQTAQPWMEQAQGYVAADDSSSQLMSAVLDHMSSTQGFSLEGLVSTLQNAAGVTGQVPDMTLPGVQNGTAYPALP